jgi:AAA domain
MATPAPVPRPVTAAKASTPTRPSRIGAVKVGQLRSSLRHLFYGPEGVGKSSLAADAPKPLFLDVEGGADNIDVARYVFRDEEGGHVPRSYADVISAIEDLIANPGHGYETLVIDTIDALEALVHRHVCDVGGKTSIEEFGFGKGYQVALDEFRVFLRLLDSLRAKGVQVVMLGHSIVKTFKNPEGEDFDRYQLRVHDKAGGLIKEWCDVVGFVRFDGGAAKLKGDASQAKRARGWATGKRIVHLSREAAWDAKTRLSIPAEIELDVAHPWAPFAEAESATRDSSGPDLMAHITAELDRIGLESFTTAAGKATTRTDVLALVERADSTIRTRVLAGLKATNPAQES